MAEPDVFPILPEPIQDPTAAVPYAGMLVWLSFSPRIVGEAVGLHPMTVIASVLVWALLLGGLLGGSPGSSAFAEPPPVVDVVGETPKSFPLALQHAGKHARWCGVAGWGCSMCKPV